MENLSKIEVASRQVSEAVRMFFWRRDSLAVHTIVHAAHQILSDLCKLKGIETVIKNNALLRPEKSSEWNSEMNKAANFLKHADRDPESTLAFNPKLTEGFLFDCVHMINEITKNLSTEQHVFLMWFNMTHPDLVREGPMKTAIAEALSDGLDPNDFELISEFLETKSNAI